MNTLLKQIQADDRKAMVEYQINRVHAWQRTPSKSYNVVGYARRRPGPLLAMWRAFVGVFKCRA